MLDEELLKRVNEITATRYENEEDIKDLAEAIIDELLGEIEHRDEEIKHILQDRKDNFRRLTIEELLR